MCQVKFCLASCGCCFYARSLPRAVIRLGHKADHLTTTDGIREQNDVGNVTLPLISKRGRGTLKRRKSIRPMAGRKNKEGREKAIKDHREVSMVVINMAIKMAGPL